jgi:hypothetical protein
LFLLLVRLAPQSAPWSAPLGAAVLAALWFLHPVHADSVLLLSGRSAVLSGLFLLASLLALERARPWLAGLLLVLACLSRETALAGLLPLLVLAASRPGASLRSTLHATLPSLLGGALVLAWILTTPRYLQLAEYSFLGRPFWSSLASQVGAVPVGLGLLFNPAALSIDYGIPLPTRISDPGFLLGAALYAAAAAGVLVFLCRSRAAAVGLALWLAALLPTQSVVPKLDALTNRPLALALAGLLIAATPLVARLLAWTMRSLNNDSRRLETAAAQEGLRLAGAGCALLLVSLLTTSTAARAQLFESDLALWQDAAAKSTVNARPHLQYALLLLRAGEEVEAGSVLDAAQRIDPFSTQIAVLSRIHPAAEVFP